MLTSAIYLLMGGDILVALLLYSAVGLAAVFLVVTALQLRSVLQNLAGNSLSLTLSQRVIKRPGHQIS